MALPRHSIEDFAIANDAYIGGQVTFFIATAGGVASATKATLYSDLTGAGVLPNPQTLNSRGFFQQPVYIDVDVVGEIDAGAVSGTTGVIGYGGGNRGTYATATRYFSLDTIIGPSGQVPDVTGNLYESTTIFNSTNWTADLAYLTLLLDYQGLVATVVPFATRANINSEVANKAMPADQFKGSKFDPTGKHMISISAASMQPATTSGAAPGTVETATNKVLYRTLDYDQTTSEGAGFVLPSAKSVDETVAISFRARWTAAAGTIGQGVKFRLFAMARSDGEAIDVGFGAGNGDVTDLLVATGAVHLTAESSAITIGQGLSEGDLVFFEIFRIPADAADTLAADARLIAIDIFITTNAGNDA